MPQRRHIVLIETARGLTPAGFTVPVTAAPVDVAMTVRERGLEPYRVRCKSEAEWHRQLLLRYSQQEVAHILDCLATIAVRA
jgi:hypothetical protein